MTRNQDLVDIHLLRVLIALVAERSVSRAAVRMNQTQPAISAALKRLRDAFGDPILVRERVGMVPTPRALQLRDHARGVLGGIHQMLAEPELFTPASTTATFTVATPDYLAATFMAELVERLRAEAPQAQLVLHLLTSDYDYEDALANDSLDIVIANWPQPPDRMHLSLLIEDEIVCILRRAHPLAAPGAMTLFRYLEAAHVIPTPSSKAHRPVVDSHLASLRLAREPRVVVPYYAMAPYMVARSDLIFTTARHFAEQFTPSLPIVTVPAPEGFPRMRFYQLWHERSHHQAAHQWLRSLLSDVGRRLVQRSYQGPASMTEM